MLPCSIAIGCCNRHGCCEHVGARHHQLITFLAFR